MGGERTGPGVTAAEAIVEVLARADVRVVFGIPGVHNLALFEALERAGLRTVIARHEGAAAHAADGHARASGRTGVVVTTTGPGAANTLTATGEAWAASSPVLHLTTEVPTEILADGVRRRTLHQSPAQRESFVPLVRTALRAGAPGEAAGVVAEALRATRAGRPGPAYVEIPTDVLSGPGRPAGLADGWNRPAAGPPDPAAVGEAARLLAAAPTAAIWAGGGVIHAGPAATEALLRLAERLAAPVVTTFMGRGAIPDDHPLALGLPPHEPEVAALLAASDVLLAAGTDLDGTMTQNQRLGLPSAIVRVDLEPLPAGMSDPYPAVPVAGDAALALPALDRALVALGVDRSGTDAERTAARLRALREAVRTDLRADPATAEAVRLLDGMRAGLPPQTVVVADMCVAGYWAGGYLPVRAPRRLLYPVGWGTLGFGLPAAVGAALAHAGPTLAVVGDAGLMYHVGELATAVQERLDLVVLVVNDEGYGVLRFDERRVHGRTFATDLLVPDLERLAGSFGAACVRVDLDGLADALRAAVAAGGVRVLELRAELTPPRTTSRRWPTRRR